MTLEQLRIFVAVAEREHLTKAAQAFNLTPSAVSAAIAALEARHDTRLFDRVGRRILLTDAGRNLLVEARAILAQVKSAEQMLVDLAGLVRGTLSLVGSQTVANYWLPEIIQRYRLRYPGISVRIDIGNSDFVVARVRDGSADLGMVEGEVDEAALAAVPVAMDGMVMVAPVSHPWVYRPPVTAQDWAQGPWVLREQGSATRVVFDSLMTRLGVAPGTPNVVLEYPSNEAIRGAVAAGSGVTVISRRVVESAIRAGAMAVVNIDIPSRRFLALRHRERYVTRAAQAFIDLASGSEPAEDGSSA